MGRHKPSAADLPYLDGGLSIFLAVDLGKSFPLTFTVHDDKVHVHYINDHVRSGGKDQNA